MLGEHAKSGLESVERTGDGLYELKKIDRMFRFVSFRVFPCPIQVQVGSLRLAFEGSDNREIIPVVHALNVYFE